MARIIGLVLARSHSTGIERKNLKLLAGHPLLVWTLVPACQACDLVLVSSDDPEIRAVASDYRTIIHTEPAMLASGRVGDLPVVLDLLQEITVDPDDIFVLLRPTAPFRRADEIVAVATLLRNLPVDSVRSVVLADDHAQKLYLHGGWTRFSSASGRDAVPYLTPATDRHRANHPRQWLLPTWKPVGFVDAVRADVVCGLHSMEGDIIIGWLAPTDRAIDLDHDTDFAHAEALALRYGWTPDSCRNA